MLWKVIGGSSPPSLSPAVIETADGEPGLSRRRCYRPGPRGGRGTLPPVSSMQQELSALRRFRGGSIPINYSGDITSIPPSSTSFARHAPVPGPHLTGEAGRCQTATRRGYHRRSMAWWRGRGRGRISDGPRPRLLCPCYLRSAPSYQDSFPLFRCP